MRKNKLLLSIFLIVQVSICLNAKETGATETKYPKFKRSKASQIAHDKGVHEPKEILNWSQDVKNIPKDWIKADNKYFSVYYPKCFGIETNGQSEGDYKTSQGISLRRSPECSGYVSGWVESNWLSVMYEFLREAKNVNIKTMLLGTHTLYRQNLKLNNLESYISGIIHEASGIQLRWQVVVLCKGKVFRATFTVPSGEPSEARIKNNDYSVPEDFKKIISTFQCNEIP